LKNDILFQYHDDVLCGHFSIEKTFKKISEKYFWEGMIGDVKIL